MSSVKLVKRGSISRRQRQMAYYVYIILCEGNRFYTGHTKNLNSRIKLHQKGKAARFTRMHPPKKLIHVEEFHSRAEAMKREKRIKKLSHLQKLKLANHQTKPQVTSPKR